MSIDNVLINKEDREKLAAYVKEGVKILNAIENLNQEKKEIGQVVKDTLNISSKEFNDIVKHTYKDEIEEELGYLHSIEEAIGILKDKTDIEEDGE